MKNSFILLFFLIGVILSTSAQDKTESATVFKLPEIPTEYTSVEERAEYLVLHYWKNYDFSDLSLISHPEITEQEFVNFIDLLPMVSMDTAVEAITNMMDTAMNADSTMFAHFAEMSENYLYDPVSPFRNEEYYIPVLQYIVSSHKVNSINKIRPQYQLDMAVKNRQGTEAADFIYTSADDKTQSMSEIEADYTILFFNNPDCNECKRVKDYMATSPVFTSYGGKRSVGILGRQARLAILAVYVDGDIPLWRSARYPKMMINAYDSSQKITNEVLYDLKSMPSLYLLDKDKRVILKDASVEAIEKYLNDVAVSEQDISR